MNSIFSLRRSKDEPYLTQILGYVLDLDRAFSKYLIEDIFSRKNTGKIRKITPELKAESGIPDVVIKCESCKIAIENKLDSPLQDGQLQGYKNDFDYVFLLQKYSTNSEEEEHANDYFSWYQIHSIMKTYLKEVSKGYSEVSKYVLGEFIKYLEEEGMAIQKVHPQIRKGVESLLMLFNQIEEALLRLKKEKEITGYRPGQVASMYKRWEVYLTERGEFEIYVLYDPLTIFTCFMERKNYSAELRQLKDVHPKIPWDGHNYWHLIDFNLDKESYLSLSVDNQIIELMHFIENSKSEYLL